MIDGSVTIMLLTWLRMRWRRFRCDHEGEFPVGMIDWECPKCGRVTDHA